MRTFVSSLTDLPCGTSNRCGETWGHPVRFPLVSNYTAERFPRRLFQVRSGSELLSALLYMSVRDERWRKNAETRIPCPDWWRWMEGRCFGPDTSWTVLPAPGDIHARCALRLCSGQWIEHLLRDPWRRSPSHHAARRGCSQRSVRPESDGTGEDEEGHRPSSARARTDEGH